MRAICCNSGIIAMRKELQPYMQLIDIIKILCSENYERFSRMF